MPSISRFRIVNFLYNNGNRFIPDLRFNCEDSKHQTVDTFIDATNGGAKTVMTQLMLQPIIPGVSIQERSMGSFFSDGKNKFFYVLLEWKLDNTNDRLLTGIAISAPTNVDSNEKNKSNGINYFTFLNHYSLYNDKYSINNFPLCVETNGRFEPTGYNELRNIVKKNQDANTNLKYYPSYSVREYKRTLEEYGIMEHEWKSIIAKINNKEDGLSIFLDNYKTSDALLDDFIIAEISNNNTVQDNTECTAESMFLNYAERYSQQSKNISISKNSKWLIEDLKKMIPHIKKIEDCSGIKNSAINSLFDYILTAELMIKEKANEIESTEKEIEEQEKLKKHIELERISKDYYKSEDVLRLATDEYETLKKEETDAKILKEKYEHQKNVLSLAKDFIEITELRNKMESLEVQINILLNQNAETANYLNSLKYSLQESGKVKLKALQGELDSKIKDLNQTKEKLKDLQNKINKLEKNKNEKQCEFNSLQGKKEQVYKDINDKFSELNIYISHMFDDTYSKKEIDEYNKSLNKQLIDEQTTLNDLHQQEIKYEKESEEIKNKESVIQIQINSINEKIRSVNAEIEQYQKKYDLAKNVIDRINMGEEYIFTKAPLQYLQEEVINAKNELELISRKCLKMQDQFAYAKKGQLHIQQNAIDFLVESEIDFTTGEKYLLSMEEDVRKMLLDTCPAVAYSVIVKSDKEKNVLLEMLQSKEDIWIPSLVPIYTYEDISNIIEGKENFGVNESIIAAYSKLYFNNNNNYMLILKNELLEIQKSQEQYEEYINDVESDIQKIEELHFYTKDYYNNIQHQEKNLHIDLQQKEDEYEDVQNRKKKIKSEKEQNRIKQNEIRNCINKTQFKIKVFADVCQKIENYSNLCIDIAQKEMEISKIQESLKMQVPKYNNLIIAKDTKEQALEQLQENVLKCKDALKRFSGKIEGNVQLIDKPFERLQMDYDAFIQNEIKDTSSLQYKYKEYERKKIEKEKIFEKNVQKYQITLEEYSATVYSDKQFDEVEMKYNDYNTKHIEYGIKVAKKETEVENHKDNLKRYAKELRNCGGDLLPKSEIGVNFTNRKKACDTTIKNLEKRKLTLEREEEILISNKNIAEKFRKKKNYSATRNPERISIKEDSLDDIKDSIEESERSLKLTEDKVKRDISNHPLTLIENSPYKETLNSILAIINSPMENDKYNSLCSKIQIDIERYEKRINMIAIDLQDLEDSKKQLRDNCIQRAKQLYDNLNILAKKSKVKISGTVRQMIRIDLPEVAENSESIVVKMSEYIDESINDFLKNTKGMDIKTKEGKAIQYMNLRRLLNCYIGKEEIGMRFFKIDNSVSNSGYRTWEDTLKRNSGAEKVVVFFSLLFSMMNYSRGVLNALEKTSGVLILDNPFGKIQTKHLLEPVFEMAHHFNLQLICFSHSAMTEILNCFSNVYYVKVKTLPLSNMEILEPKLFKNSASEELEHASYQIEQLSLFD